MDELTALGERFLSLVAEALSLPPETFLSFLSEQHRLKLVHYPASAPEDAVVTAGDGAMSNQGVGPHKDSSGWWTFLLQASGPQIKGLQALNRSGEWVDIPAISDTFVVNIGQAFEVVTNGVCKAAIHRVLSGPHDRFSVPFFQGVRGDLTKSEAVGTLKEHFRKLSYEGEKTVKGERSGVKEESEQRAQVDSPFLRGKYDTWGESQLRTKIRSHRDVGQRHYGDVFNKYISDDE
jgi:isopenicillin N synthase-like dioxygenase